ncbi:MAG: L,D-transpeptidase family protein [Fibrobacteria bacterium]
MRSIVYLLFPAVFFLFPGSAAAGWGFFSGGKGPTAQALLEKKLAALDADGRVQIAGETVIRTKELSDFYHARNDKPAWLSHGRPAAAAWHLLDAVRKCGQEGLEPADYHVRGLDALLRAFNRKLFWRARNDPEAGALVELLATDAYLKLGRDLLSGRVRPKIPQDFWHVGAEKTDLAGLLDRTLSEKKDLRACLQALTPPQREYGQMKYWLGEYRKLAEKGGWRAIPDGPALGPQSPQSEGKRVVALCERLKVTGEMGWGGCGETFESDIGEAVKRFQASHGLEATGVADAATLRSLNIPVENRIDQIELNLECWRWLPQDLGDRHIRVNIVDFRLSAFEKGKEEFSMRVVVGRKEDSTPVFSDRAVSIQLNPAWNVPASIAGEELLPELQKDPDYLAKHNMELLGNWSESAPVIRADSVDWWSVTGEEFPFRIRQKNGDASALGRIKFVMTNPYNIYLHDTPAKKYFENDKRALSHGCVRVSDPEKLALWVLGPDSAWDARRLEEEIGKGKETFIPVPGQGVPVHILYWTCFVDNQGGLQFRPDLYRWNRKMESALARKSRSF